MKFGFLNIYKPVRMTSHDVVATLRKLLNIKQIGHTGTLDPFAEGVLPVCIGKATRLIEFLDDDKEYLAKVQFGASTTTYDRDGEVIFTSDRKVTIEDVTQALQIFEGEILQTPPIYSAIKVNGKKLYEYARKGDNIEIQPRKVTIACIELKSFNEEQQQAEILIKCSKGTYIRSIAYDLGKKLGCGAYLVKLVRTRAGKFTIENSIKIEDALTSQNLINPLDMLDYPKINLNDEAYNIVHNGGYLDNKYVDHGSIVILVYNEREVCAVAKAEHNKIKMRKVFI